MLLPIILLVVFILFITISSTRLEDINGYALEPFSQQKNNGLKTDLLLDGSFPVHIMNGSVGQNNKTRMSSFSQITNNFRFPRNPDNGSNYSDIVFYDSIKNKTNIVRQLPPAKINKKRVGYFVQ
jgi:hypothetical protein